MSVIRGADLDKCFPTSCYLSIVICLPFKVSHLQLVLLELGRLRLLERDGHAGDGVVVGAALQRREDRAVDPLDSGEEETRLLYENDLCFH